MNFWRALEICGPNSKGTIGMILSMVKPTSFSLLSETSNPDWLVRDLIPRRGLALFTGGRESGKTIVALLLAQGVAAKYAFLRQPCAQHATAFISRYEKGSDISQLA